MEVNDNKAVAVFSFEEGIPSCFETDESSRLTLSHKHFKDGKYSLCWDYHKNGWMTIKTPIGYTPFQEGAVSQARDTFAVWIYNELPIDDEVIFEFGRKSQVDCWFSFKLNFQGWRTAWVMFERDMQGQPHPDMDTIKIKAPEGRKNGRIYFDQMILSNPVDPRYPTRDYQVPFVNLEADQKANSHWLSLYYFSQLKPSIPIHETVIQKDKEAFEIISKRYKRYILEEQVNAEKSMEQIRTQFAEYNIVREHNDITGHSLDVVHYYDIYPKSMKEELKHLSNSMDVRTCMEFLLDIAQKYILTDNSREQEELKQMFIDLTDQLYDQGWAEGSSLGTTHHLGYCLRDYYAAMFLMRTVLHETGRVERTQKAMAWFSGLGRIFYQTSKVQGSNMDVLNTLVQGMMASILMMQDSVEKICYLESYSLWIKHCLMPAPGLSGPFKIDGCTFHHCNHYPAYALGGLSGVTPIVYFLSGTSYRIGEHGHKNLKKSVLAMRIFSNKYTWLVSLSSRHPKGKGQHCEIDVVPFKYLALAGTPNGQQEIDGEVAAAYLRLVPCGNKDWAEERFREYGIAPENDPNGHWTMNYGALTLHRRDNWLVGARGHSRYLWANETYLAANLYGRYITHGHVQILSQGDPVNNTDSGFVHDGWDWNRWPGTTTIHLPLDELRSDVRNVDTFSGFEEMLLSDETYAGGVNLQGENGMFAMKLHEHPKYNGTHRARKSVFFFDNKIICLGSNIENKNTEYATETTLFQNHLKQSDTPIWVNSENPIEGLDYSKRFIAEKDTWLLDNNDNGYFIPKGQKIAVSRSMQDSKSQQDGSDTQGAYACAWIDHGRAPQNQEYEYAILVKTTKEDIKAFTTNMEQVETAPYTVLQKDRDAHIVKDCLSNTIGYALFEASNDIDKGAIKGVDTPSMVMTKESGEDLYLSICDPDLRLYEGIDHGQYDQDGNRIEVSVYSRPWKNSPSKSHHLKLTLKGKWNLKFSKENCNIVCYDNDTTILKFICQDAMPVEVVLSKI